MKATSVNSLAAEDWSQNKGRLKQIFAWLTGYDIMFEESRKDLVPERLSQGSKSSKRK